MMPTVQPALIVPGGTIWLVRHGEVAGNTGDHRTFVGWSDLPLTERGRRQANAVAARLKREKIHYIIASDLSRARDTADLIARPHSVAVETDPGWREVNYGAWEGLGQREIEDRYAAEWTARFADPIGYRVPQGECYRDMWRRVQPLWKRLVQTHPGENRVLVGHAGTIRLMVCHLMNAPLARFRTVQIDNCSLTQVTLFPDAGHGQLEPRLACVNDTCHLEGI